MVSKYLLCSLFALMLCFTAGVSFGQNDSLSGTVIDASNGYLPYVNIGIKGKNVGTLSNQQGQFVLKIDKNLLDDSVTLSCVGYNDTSLLIRTFVNRPLQKYLLTQRYGQLEPVIVSAGRTKTAKIGIRSRSPLVSGTVENKNKSDISEFAQLIKLDHKPSRLQSASIFLLGVKIDSASFRINFYRNNDGLPGDRIETESIFSRVSLKNGWLSIDLTRYNIVLQEDFFITWEFFPEKKASNYSFVYGARLGGNTVFRTSSLGTWTKQGGACLSAYITVKQPE